VLVNKFRNGVLRWPPFEDDVCERILLNDETDVLQQTRKRAMKRS
jgi:hypothetical protein